MEAHQNTMSKLALFGHPVSHSLSPMIHQLFGQAQSLVLDYQLKDTLPGQLSSALFDFKERGGIGANITLPLKVEAYHLCDCLTENARMAQAVNTLYWQENKLWGENTDGQGLVNDLTLNIKINLKNKNLLLLGAGGAARGILFPLLQAGVGKITIVNRTLSAAQNLALLDPRLTAVSYDHLDHVVANDIDMVINATSASLKNELPPLAPHWCKNKIVMDLAYLPQEMTLFLKWAQVHGAVATHDGIGMLVEQAALSFQYWFGKKPETRGIITSLRKGHQR